MIRRKEKGITIALLIYVLMILMVIGFRVKAEAQAPWGYGWGQGYYPAWGGSQYPFSGSFQGAYQWGGPQYTAWGQQPYAFAPASYGLPGYYGQVNGYNATRQSAVFGMPVPPEIAALFPYSNEWEFFGGEIVYGPPSWETTKPWETGIGYFSDPGIDTFTSGTRYFNNEYISYSWETGWEADLRNGIISSIPPQR